MSKRMPSRPLPHLTGLAILVAEIFNVAFDDIFKAHNERSRPTRSVADARAVMMWRIRTSWDPQPSLPEIGGMIGLDHTSVSQAVKRINHAIEKRTPLGLLALRIAGRPLLHRVAGEGVIFDEDADEGPELQLELLEQSA